MLLHWKLPASLGKALTASSAGGAVRFAASQRSYIGKTDRFDGAVAAYAHHLAAVHRPPFAVHWLTPSVAAAAAPRPMRHPTPPLML